MSRVVGLCVGVVVTVSSRFAGMKKARVLGGGGLVRERKCSEDYPRDLGGLLPNGFLVERVIGRELDTRGGGAQGDGDQEAEVGVECRGDEHTECEYLLFSAHG